MLGNMALLRQYSMFIVACSFKGVMGRISDAYSESCGAGGYGMLELMVNTNTQAKTGQPRH